MTVNIPWISGLKLDKPPDHQQKESASTNASSSSMRTRKLGSKLDPVTHHKFDTLINPGSEFQITNLDDPHPLMQLSNNMGIGADADSAISNASLIDGKIFSMNWAKLVGTDLVFDDYGELIGKVKDHLICDTSIDIANNEVVEEEEVPKMKREKGAEVTTLFFKKALQAAIQKHGEKPTEGAETETAEATEAPEETEVGEPMEEAEKPTQTTEEKPSEKAEANDMEIC